MLNPCWTHSTLAKTSFDWLLLWFHISFSYPLKVKGEGNNLVLFLLIINCVILSKFMLANFQIYNKFILLSCFPIARILDKLSDALFLKRHSVLRLGVLTIMIFLIFGNMPKSKHLNVSLFSQRCFNILNKWNHVLFVNR